MAHQAALSLCLFTGEAGRPVSQEFCTGFCIVLGMVILQQGQEISVTDAARRGVAGIVRDAEQGAEFIVTRRREPVAAVVAYERWAGLERAETDLKDLALVLARSMGDSGERTPLDDVLTAFGHTRSSLEELPEV